MATTSEYLVDELKAQAAARLTDDGDVVLHVYLYGSTKWEESKSLQATVAAQ